MNKLLLVLSLSACATTGPLDVEIRVSDLGDDERAALDAQLCALDRMRSCEATLEGQTRVYDVEWDGSLSDLQYQISQFPNPGLEPSTQMAFISYVGYDNLPPEIAFVAPVDGVTVNTVDLDLVVAVTGDDVVRVTIDDADAQKQGKGLYRRKLKLKEGENRLRALAVDDANNEASAEILIVLDTTPPDLNSIVKVILEGTTEPGSRVFVDGRAVGVDPFGNWRVELTVKKGKNAVEVIAIDDNGNKKTERRKLFE